MDLQLAAYRKKVRRSGDARSGHYLLQHQEHGRRHVDEGCNGHWHCASGADPRLPERMIPTLGASYLHKLISSMRNRSAGSTQGQAGPPLQPQRVFSLARALAASLTVALPILLMP